MSKPSWMNKSDWDKVNWYAYKYHTSPEVLAAIGWHETHWGKLGWGKQGYYLGVGCYSEKEANPYYKGLDRQLDWAARQLGSYLGQNITLSGLKSFARNVWKPGNPDAWAESVYHIYLEIGGKTVSEDKLPNLGTVTDCNISSELELKIITRVFEEMSDMLRNWVKNKRL